MIKEIQNDITRRQIAFHTYQTGKILSQSISSIFYYWNKNEHIHYGKQHCLHYLVKLNMNTSSHLILLIGNSGYPKETSTCAKGNMFINVHGSSIYNSKKIRRNPNHH